MKLGEGCERESEKGVGESVSHTPLIQAIGVKVLICAKWNIN
jgi:hypothetical protein